MENSKIMTEHRAFARERKMAPIAFSRCAFALLLFLVTASVVITVLLYSMVNILGADRAFEFFYNPYVQYALQVVVMYVIAFSLFLLVTRGMSRTYYERRKMGFGQFTVLFFISQFLMLFGSYVSSFISFLISPSGAQSSVVSEFISDTPIWLVVLVVVIIAPIIEEFVFRKILIDRLSVYGDRLAVVVSSVAFGLFHGNLEQLLYATLLGVLFGYIYTKTRNIGHSILLHMLVNLMGGVVPLIAMNSANEVARIAEGGGENAIALLVHLLAVYGFIFVRFGFALCGLILLLWAFFAKKIRFSRKCYIKLPSRTVFRCAFFNFGTILFIGYTAVQIALVINPALLENVLSFLYGVIS